MDNQYIYEQMASQRQLEIGQQIAANRLRKAVRAAQEPTLQLSTLLDELTRRRRVLRLGRLVIMW